MLLSYEFHRAWRWWSIIFLLAEWYQGRYTTLAGIPLTTNVHRFFAYTSGKHCYSKACYIYIAANWISKAAKSKAPFESSFCMHGRSPWLVGDISLRYPQIVQAYLLDNFYKFYLIWKFWIVPHKNLCDILACFIGFFYKNGEFRNIRKGIPFSLKTCIFRRRIIYPAIAETTPRSQGRHPPLRRKESPAFVVPNILLISVKIRILLRQPM